MAGFSGASSATSLMGFHVKSLPTMAFQYRHQR
jgi:hypothetical protein